MHTSIWCELPAEIRQPYVLLRPTARAVRPVQGPWVRYSDLLLVDDFSLDLRCSGPSCQPDMVCLEPGLAAMLPSLLRLVAALIFQSYFDEAHGPLSLADKTLMEELDQVNSVKAGN